MGAEPLKEPKGQVLRFPSDSLQSGCPGRNNRQSFEDSFWVSPSRNRMTQEFEHGATGSELARAPSGSRLKLREDDQPYRKRAASDSPSKFSDCVPLRHP